MIKVVKIETMMMFESHKKKKIWTLKVS